MGCFSGRVIARRDLPPDGAVFTVKSDGGQRPDPFQFYMLSVPGDESFPFLPRPFSVYDAAENSIDFLIKVIGPGTAALARAELGDEVMVTGPLGKGVTSFSSDVRTVGVAGGVGIAPFLILYRAWKEGRIEGGQDPLLIYGARTEEYLYDLDLFSSLPVEVKSVTEDGSHGDTGRVTDVLGRVLNEGPAEVIACGPDPMLEAVADLCRERGAVCRLSLETYMACGYGVCNACAVKVNDERYRDGYRYDRCCVEGPVFDAATIEL